MSIREDLDVEVAEWLRDTQDLSVYAVLDYETEVSGCDDFIILTHEVQTRVVYTEDGFNVKDYYYPGTMEELLDEL